MVWVKMYVGRSRNGCFILFVFLLQEYEFGDWRFSKAPV